MGVGLLVVLDVLVVKALLARLVLAVLIHLDCQARLALLAYLIGAEVRWLSWFARFA